MKNKLLFKVIAVFIPLIFLVIIEISLRLINLLPPLDLFITYPENDKYYVLNPYFSKRYFTYVQDATKGFADPFKKDKDQHTIRIFVQGASTAVGFPYFHNGSFHRMLKYRLENAYPEMDFEVVNLSLTAVNSYTLADQAEEIIEQKPDAVLIYAGHNEYYGALGVSSTNRLTRNPVMVRMLIRFNQLHIIRLLNSIFVSNPDLSADAPENLMQRMAGQTEIRYKSAIFQGGVDQFESNLDRLLKKYDQSNIPVFLSTIASNYKDQPPLISKASNEADSVKLSNLILEAEKSLKESEILYAQKLLREALILDSAYARTHFKLGKIYLAKNELRQARKHFILAKEYDVLRFRAPEMINQIIRNKAKNYGVNLVETKEFFEQNSKNGIIGEDLMLEHLHPNLLGYLLISEAFYQKVKNISQLDRPGHENSFKEFIKMMPLTEVDSIHGFYTTIVMKEQWPFNNPVNHTLSQDGKTIPEHIAGKLVLKQVSWDQAMEDLYNYYQDQNDLARAVKVAEATVLEHPLSDILSAKTAQLHAKLSNYQKAVMYYQKALKINQNSLYARKIGQYLILLGYLEAAKTYFAFAAEHDKKDKISPQAIESIIEIQQIERAILESEPEILPMVTLIMNYMKLGHKEKAKELFLQAKKIEPNHILIEDLGNILFSN